MDTELLKALELVAEYDATRAVVSKEFRLYYDNDGVIIGLWETDYPEGQYIVLDDPTIFANTSTLLLRVQKGQLIRIATGMPIYNQLTKSNQGQPTVAGHAALALRPDEEYTDIEYYDTKTHS